MQCAHAMKDAERDDVMLLDRPVIVVDEPEPFEDDDMFAIVDDDSFDAEPEDVILLDTLGIDDSDLEPA